MLFVSDVVSDKRRVMTEKEKALFGIDKLNVKRSDIPAVTHVDYSARVQTVHRETNPKYYELISEFEELCAPEIKSFPIIKKGTPFINGFRFFLFRI